MRLPYAVKRSAYSAMPGSRQSLLPAKPSSVVSAQAFCVAQFCRPLTSQSCSYIRLVLVSSTVPLPWDTSAACAAPVKATMAAAAAQDFVNFTNVPSID